MTTKIQNAISVAKESLTTTLDTLSKEVSNVKIQPSMCLHIESDTHTHIVIFNDELSNQEVFEKIILNCSGIDYHLKQAGKPRDAREQLIYELVEENNFAEFINGILFELYPLNWKYELGVELPSGHGSIVLTTQDSLITITVTNYGTSHTTYVRSAYYQISEDLIIPKLSSIKDCE